mgnify:CR=1 FL=1
MVLEDGRLRVSGYEVSGSGETQFVDEQAAAAMREVLFDGLQTAG